MRSGRREVDVFEGINPEDLEQEIPESRWRGPVVIFLGLFLLALVVSLSFSDFLQGIVHSKSLRQNALYFPNATILFEGNTLELLQDEFTVNEHREIKACLFGKQAGNTYIISKVEFPEVIKASVAHVVSVPCQGNVLIDLHSHPINRCLASEQDMEVYDYLRQSNPSLRMMVMCSSTRYAIV
jgi:proteasome lid subunit RPN8/RPN11